MHAWPWLGLYCIEGAAQSMKSGLTFLLAFELPGAVVAVASAAGLLTRLSAILVLLFLAPDPPAHVAASWYTFSYPCWSVDVAHATPFRPSIFDGDHVAPL